MIQGLIILDGRPINGWSLAPSLSEKYPEAVITPMSNHTLDQNVLASKDNQEIINKRIKTLATDSLTASQNVNDFDFFLEFCYCSEYGKCWKVKGLDDIKPSQKCVFIEDIS